MNQIKTHAPYVLLAALIGLALVSGCGNEAKSAAKAKPEIWRFAIEESLGSVQHAYAVKFKELIEERTEGKVEVIIYPYGTLGTSDQTTEQLKLRSIQFAMASPGHLGKMIPEVQVFLLHFVLSDDEEVNKRVLGENLELRRSLTDLYRQKGFQFLAVFSEGWQVWTTNQPIREPDDFQGVKIRVMTSPMLMAAYEAYGASPTPLPFGEVYSALQLNMIDAQVNPVFAIQEMSFYEVTEWMTFANHAPFITTAMADGEFFDNLSPERQALVQQVIAELDDYIFDVQLDYNLERLELIEKRRPDLNVVREFDEKQREQFRKKSLTVRDTFIEKVGPAGERLLNQLLDAVAEAEHR